MLTVYEHPLSPYAQKVKIALREKELQFEVASPGAVHAAGSSDNFQRLNPRSEVPVLVHDDAAIFDSTIILEYIEDKWPRPPLLPAAALDRARVRMIEDVMDTHFEAINWGLGEIGWFKRATGALATSLLESAARQTFGYFSWLERQLGDMPWFNGSEFGWGDLSVVPYVAASVGLGNRPREGGPLSEWLVRAMEREAVSVTIGEAMSFDRQSSNVPELVAQGLFKREYRDHRLEWMIRSGGLEIVLKGLEAGNIRFTETFGP